MLRVFPITLNGAAKRWVDRLTPGTINIWDLLQKDFTQRYCPPSKTAKQLEDIATSSKREKKHCTKLEKDSHGPIPGMTPAKGMATIASKLDNLGRDMKKLKENVHAIQVGYQLYGGPHLDKECPLNEEVKSIEEVKYGEFGRPFPNNIRVNEKFRELPPKEEDPGSFILPCSIGRLDFNNALADLGASISIMPLSMYKRLGMGKLELINMVIEMADNTKSIPKGIVKNLLIKINKFILPVDFVILDMIEDFRMPIILGRPLLATVHAKVDIFRKTISLELVPKVVPLADTTAPSKQELDLLFGPLYDEFFTADTSCVNKYSSPTDNSKQQDTPPSTTAQSTTELITPTTTITTEDNMLYGGGGIPFQLKSDSLPHGHAQTTKTYYKHQGSRIKKAQELKTKTSANSDINDPSSETKLQ
ncbi:zinc knuckle CX2CX4HX4C containing protein [Tanacetum coccineum]